MPPVLIRGEEVDVAAIHAALRARVLARRAGELEPAPSAVAEALAARLEPLDDWGFPRPLWQAMYPPNLEPWNLDEDFPIRSHRRGYGALLVAVKRLWRAALRPLLWPLLVRQAEINRTLALMTQSLAEDLARTRLEVRALEARLARVGGVVQEDRGLGEPLVAFEEPAR